MTKKKTPTEKDWQDANKWVNEQLEMIEKYGTVMVTKPWRGGAPPVQPSNLNWHNQSTAAINVTECSTPALALSGQKQEAR